MYNNVQNSYDLTRWTHKPMRPTEAMELSAEYQMLYPEIFYQLQPYIMEACDQMDACGYMMPDREMLKSMGDRIQKRFELGGAETAAAESGRPRAARGGGLFRDLLDILLLTELFGRRRRYYY